MLVLGVLVQSHYQVFAHTVRAQTLRVLTPIYHIVDVPQRWVDGLLNQWILTDQMQTQLTQLRHENMVLQSTISQLKHAKIENTQLRQLLGAASVHASRSILAELVRVSVRSDPDIILLNRGRSDGIYVGQPVLDGFGIVGQVIAIADQVCEVMRVTHPNSGILVSERTHGDRYALMGQGGNHLRVDSQEGTYPLKVGMILQTTGLDDVYPRGYPVAKVDDITITEAGTQVRLKPMAHLFQSRQFLLIWPKHS